MITKEALTKIERDFKSQYEKASTAKEVEELRIRYLGRKQGLLQRLYSEIPKLSIEKKKKLVPELNSLKQSIERVFSKRETTTKQVTRATNVSEFYTMDPTSPGLRPDIGHSHPTIQIIDEIKEIFAYLGFDWMDGPEVEFDSYNFQKLRLHKDHPARDTQQTYYINDEVLLRTQTSSMQIRYMETHKPPLRMLFPGRVYRREQLDATHLPAFYQIEGLLVSSETKMTDLIGVLDYFAKKMFGEKTRVRFYGHHFPYTEPSIEVEVLYKNGKWLEILGAGMVHPEVLKNCKIDPKKYRGWAFGMGPERIAMLKYGIEDIRLFYSNDRRFLDQF